MKKETIIKQLEEYCTIYKINISLIETFKNKYIDLFIKGIEKNIVPKFEKIGANKICTAINGVNIDASVRDTRAIIWLCKKNNLEKKENRELKKMRTKAITTKRKEYILAQIKELIYYYARKKTFLFSKTTEDGCFFCRYTEKKIEYQYEFIQIPKLYEWNTYQDRWGIYEININNGNINLLQVFYTMEDIENVFFSFETCIAINQKRKEREKNKKKEIYFDFNLQSLSALILLKKSGVKSLEEVQALRKIENEKGRSLNIIYKNNNVKQIKI